MLGLLRFVVKGPRFLVALAGFFVLSVMFLPFIMDGETGSALDPGQVFVQIPGDDPGRYSSIPVFPHVAAPAAFLLLEVWARRRRARGQGSK